MRVFVNQCRFTERTRPICRGTAKQYCGFINTTAYSRGDTSIRKAYQETRHSGSVMSPVHVIMQGDWTLYWRLTLKPKRKECYILVLYRKVLPPITKILQQRRENRRNRYYERLTYHHHLAERIVFRVTIPDSSAPPLIDCTCAEI